MGNINIIVNAKKRGARTPRAVDVEQTMVTIAEVEAAAMIGYVRYAIVLMEHVDEGKVAVMPLFVAITGKMEIVFEGENGEGCGGGGPRREFKTNKDATPPVLRHLVRRLPPLAQTGGCVYRKPYPR